MTPRAIRDDVRRPGVPDRVAAALVAATTALAAAGCSPPDLTPTSEVIRLRTLAIEAEPAEIAFGETVSLRPVIADPWNEGYSVQWMPCIEAEIGGFVACDFENMLVDMGDPFSLAALTDETLSFTVDQDVVAGMLADLDAIDRADGLGLQFLLLLLPRGKTFFDYLPEFDTTQATDPDYVERYGEEATAALEEVFEALIRQSRIAYKRVLVSDVDSVGIARHDEGECADLPGLARNVAPHLGGLLQVDDGVEIAWPSGVTLTVAAGESLELSPMWNPEDRERYYHVAWSGDTECRVEEPFFGWYATAGSFSDSDGFATDYTNLDADGLPQRVRWTAPRSVPAINPVHGWVVAWDRRGGLSHVRFDLLVEDGESGP